MLYVALNYQNLLQKFVIRYNKGLVLHITEKQKCCYKTHLRFIFVVAPVFVRKRTVMANLKSLKYCEKMC